MRTYLKSKLHRAKVTQCDLDYEGSITIDPYLMDRADIAPYEQVHVWNVTNGQRFVTYAIEGDRGTGVIGINGAAAHLCNVDDIVIIATFESFHREDFFANTRPLVVIFDEKAERVNTPK